MKTKTIETFHARDFPDKFQKMCHIQFDFSQTKRTQTQISHVHFRWNVPGVETIRKAKQNVIFRASHKLLLFYFCIEHEKYVYLFTKI
jgi:hypothetical protein